MILPDENEKILKYQNFRFKENVPFVICADAGCLLKGIFETQANIEFIKSIFLTMLHTIYIAAFMILQISSFCTSKLQYKL